MKKESEGIDHVVIGKILKANREANGDTQLNIATKLGYRNVNFIYLIEQGRANIPVSKILDIVSAYSVDRHFGLAIVKHLHPDIWTLFKAMAKWSHKEMKNFSEFEKKIDQAYIEKAKEQGLEQGVSQLQTG